jgi:hypothetical protein
MHAKASFVFWVTLILYLVTLFTVSYVGVYLTYIVIPLLVVSGLVMKCSTPKSEHKLIIDDGKTVLRQTAEVTNDALVGVNRFLHDVNSSLSEYNKVNGLVSERAKFYKAEIQRLKLERIALDLNLKNETSSHGQNNIRKDIETNENH